MKTVIIKQSESLGYEEYYVETYKCSECETEDLSKHDNYCNKCGSKIEYKKDE